MRGWGGATIEVRRVGSVEMYASVAIVHWPKEFGCLAAEKAFEQEDCGGESSVLVDHAVESAVKRERGLG